MAYKKQQEEGVEQKAVRGIGRAIWSGIRRLFRVKRPAWQQTAMEKQTQIAILKTGEDSDVRQAVIEADKLLDFILINKGARGENLGEKLKGGRYLFADEISYQAAWDGHKVRNVLVHGQESVGASSCRQAVDNFLKSFRGLGL